MKLKIKRLRSFPEKLITSFTVGQLKVIAGVLTNLAAGWFGSILIFPNLFTIKIPTTFLFVLTYSLGFGILSMLAAAKIEDYLNDGK